MYERDTWCKKVSIRKLLFVLNIKLTLFTIHEYYRQRELNVCILSSFVTRNEKWRTLIKYYGIAIVFLSSFWLCHHAHICNFMATDWTCCDYWSFRSREQSWKISYPIHDKNLAEDALQSCKQTPYYQLFEFSKPSESNLSSKNGKYFICNT